MHQAEIIVLLFAAVAVVAGRRALPYPIVLVMSGLALSFVPRLPEVRLNPEIRFLFFLPPLQNRPPHFSPLRRLLRQ